MRAILSILFTFAVLMLSAAQAQASVCFLPGKLAGDCTQSPDLVACGGYTHNGPCTLSGEIQTTCDHLGHRFYKCECDPTAVQNSEIEGGTYVCRKSYNKQCGCSRNDAACNTARYPEHGCNGANSHGYDENVTGGAFCVDPRDEALWFKECLCDEGFDLTCTEEGLAKPKTTEYCELPGGNFKYTSCDCAPNWTLNTTCSSRSDGCTAEEKKVSNGAGGWCYHCINEKCPEQNQTNLEVLWCSGATKIQPNCQTLGYTTSGNCPEGQAGPACPFDKRYHFCQEITKELERVEE